MAPSSIPSPRCRLGVASTGLLPASPPVGLGDPRYPACLRCLPAPPRSLWVVGRLPEPGERLVAIVGARAASGAGCEIARALAADLGRSGIAIVSGGAFGIDAAAHQGALAARAATFAVLGCGTDIVYPDRHKGLFSAVGRSGGLLSEYPPGTKPRAGQFPARNRIIAALGEAVVVVEAAQRSGALITASRARELGRVLLAVPGSSGTDALVRAGQALPVTSAVDVERALAGELSPSAPSRPSSGPLAAVLQALDSGAATAAQLGQRLGLPLPTLLALLTEAELDGFVERKGGDIYEVNGSAC
ncbi:MAG: DNA-processing protein DprA [Deltaproteobacteria bacterium]|nr:DNA-processing protein DprA [Deltaproteobacteria bacterium]